MAAKKMRMDFSEEALKQIEGDEYLCKGTDAAIAIAMAAEHEAQQQGIQGFSDLMVNVALQLSTCDLYASLARDDGEEDLSSFKFRQQYPVKTRDVRMFLAGIYYAQHLGITKGTLL